MSNAQQIEVTCPQCNQVQAATIWRSVNRQADPEVAQKLLDGTLFEYQCCNCGTIAGLAYPVLYNDVENGCMVNLVADQEDAQAYIKSIEQISADLAEAEEGADASFVHRVVFNQSDLLEKARLLCDGLNDAAIEALKVTIKFRKEDEGHPMKGKHLYYVGQTQDGSFDFAILEDGRILTMERDLYDAFIQKGKVTAAAKGQYIIDEPWALKNVFGIQDEEVD